MVDDLERARYLRARRAIEKFKPELEEPERRAFDRVSTTVWLVDHWPLLRHASNEELAEVQSLLEAIQRRRT